MVVEKRKDKRVKEDFSILCRTYRKTELEGIVSKITDISPRGLGLITNIPLQKNDILQIIFRIPPDFREKIELFAHVLECQARSETEFKIRVVFIDIDNAAKSILHRITEEASLKATFGR